MSFDLWIVPELNKVLGNIYFVQEILNEITETLRLRTVLKILQGSTSAIGYFDLFFDWLPSVIKIRPEPRRRK